MPKIKVVCKEDRYIRDESGNITSRFLASTAFVQDANGVWQPKVPFYVEVAPDATPAQILDALKAKYQANPGNIGEHEGKSYEVTV